MTPADSRFDQRVRDSFVRQGGMATLGASLVAVEPGFVAIGMAHRSEPTQRPGFVHAGMVATALASD